MAEFLIKDIYKESEFEEAITLHDLRIARHEYVGGASPYYKGFLTPFFWSLLGSIPAPSDLVDYTFSAMSTFIPYADLFTISKAAGGQAALEHKRAARGEYYYYLGFNLQAITLNHTCQIFMIENSAGAKISFYSAQAPGFGRYFYLTYTLGATTYYLDGSLPTPVWTTTLKTWRNHTITQNDYFRIEKKNGFYYFNLYDYSESVIFAPDIELDASIFASPGVDLDLIRLGDKTASADVWTLDLIKVIGFGNENGKALGAAQYIFDLGAVPIIPGKYSNAVENYDDYDEIIDDYDVLAGLSAIAIKTAVNNERLSQGFQAAATAPIEKVVAWIKKTGTIGASYSIWAEIWTDDGGDKPLALLPGMISNKILANSYNSTQFKMVDFVFNSRVQLDAGVKYHIVFMADYTTSGSNYLSLGYRASAAAIPPRDYNGTGWANATINTTDRILSAVLNANERKLKTYLSQSNLPVYKTLSSRTDFEGYSQVASQITTSVLPNNVILSIIPMSSYYYASGYNQNDIDLGSVPSNYVNFTRREKLLAGTSITYELAYSDDGASWSSFTTLTFPNGYDTGLLTALGLHRYWRLKATLYSDGAGLRTPTLESWTIDAFGAMIEIDRRTKLPEARYGKVKVEVLRNTLTAGELSGFLVDRLVLKWRIAYELYIKAVKYRITPEDGILADMELGSVI